MGSLDQSVTGLLIAVFAHPGAALGLSGIIFAGCAATLISTWLTRVRPLQSALYQRLWAVASLVSREKADSARASFARNYDAIGKTMMAPGKQAYAFQRAWLDYQQSFVDLDPGEISSSSRAGMYFGGAGDPGRAMDWWANIFVAIGLMFTFLGIVAALSQANAVIGSGQDAQAVQAALASLLGIAAAKFWTSVAGVASSLILRLFGRRWRTRLEELEDDLCEVLDAGVRHISPQALALQQLVELRRLNASLSALSAQEGQPRGSTVVPLPTAQRSPS